MTIGAERGRETLACRRLPPIAADAAPAHHARVQPGEVDVSPHTIRILPCHEVRRMGGKRREASIGADRGIEARVVRRLSGGADADAPRRSRQSIANEDIAGPIAVGLGGQVGGIGVEHEKPTVGIQRGAS